MADIISTISDALGFGEIFFWLNKLTALFIIWWLGGKFSAKFEAKLPSALTLVIRIISGVAIYWAGVIIGAQYFSSLPFDIGDFIGAFIAFIGFYIVAELLTFGLKSKQVSRKEFEALEVIVQRLRALVLRLADASMAKGILSERVTQAEATRLCQEFMHEKGFEDVHVQDAKKEAETWVVRVACKWRTFILTLDEQTGHVVLFHHARDSPQNVVLAVTSYFYDHKLAIFGVIALIMLFVGINSLASPQSSTRIGELLSLEYAGPQNASADLGDVFGQLVGDALGQGLAGGLSGLLGGGLPLGGLNMTDQDCHDLVVQATSVTSAEYNTLSSEEQQQLCNSILSSALGNT
ncbi:hypothetical protein COT72_03470 [archaeon CG10_big_fil_rev_8_21_14_0_10_43_11]|nr:MAG: hypothetical protein COT72_03470 [archaeon CG10_big_fil_rev_8_21_14_0_10_43_11]